ncbi:MAG: hypothetical protein ABIF10_01775 [Candidatus Woesearchaeota archaeon]
MDEYEDLKELVLARLDTMPDNLQIHLGSEATFEKKDIVEHVRKLDELGKKIIEVQIAYLKESMEGF